MTTYLVMGLLAFTVAVMVLFALGNTKGKGKYIAGLAVMGFVMVGVAYFEKDRVAASMLELSVLLASIFLGVLVSKNVLDKSSSYVDELFKDEDKPDSQTQPKPSSDATNEKYVDLLKKAAKLSIFAVPFLLIVNISMQLILPVVKADDNSVIEHLGTFGDFFGGTLNPVLTFATFIALIATILIQLKELGLARVEYARAVEEQTRMATALGEQEKTQKIQQFETTFFNLMNLTFSEQDKILESVKKRIDDVMRNCTSDSPEYLCKLFFNNTPDISRFNILCYQTLNFVYESSDDINKKSYANVLRAGIYNEVLFSLMLNCSNINNRFVAGGFVKYKELVEEFSFFEHLDISSVLDTYMPSEKEDLYFSLEDTREAMAEERKLNSDENGFNHIPSEEFNKLKDDVERISRLISVESNFSTIYSSVKKIANSYDQEKAFDQSAYFSHFLERAYEEEALE